MLTLLFDGIAYGMLLFVLALGLAVTMGLMNFINLAHGAFAMAGGYILIVLMQRHGWPFLACLPVAFVVTAAAGALLERTLYRPMYGKPHLDQVLFSIGLTFMAVAAVDYFIGSSPQTVQTARLAARALRDRRGRHGSSGMGAYRLFIIAVCVALALGLQAILRAHALRQPAARRGRRPARRRRARHPGEPRVPASLSPSARGWPGSAARSAPTSSGWTRRFPLKFMVYFLIVCAVGGTSSITGPLVAALVLGIADVMGKYYVPKLGAFIVYVLMIAILLWRPQGLFTREGGDDATSLRSLPPRRRAVPSAAAGRDGAACRPAASLLAPSRWRAWEIVLWLRSPRRRWCSARTRR